MDVDKIQAALRPETADGTAAATRVHFIPKFSRAWATLTEMLSTSTTYICVFGFGIPLLSFIGTLLHDLKVRKAGITIGEVIRGSVFSWGTLLPTGLTLSAWAFVLVLAYLRTVRKGEAEMTGLLMKNAQEIHDLNLALAEKSAEAAKAHQQLLLVEGQCKELEKTVFTAHAEIAAKDAEVERLSRSPAPSIETPGINDIFVDYVDLPQLKPTVTMYFPQRVQLNTGRQVIPFEAGLQEVPIEYAGHHWLKDNGVVRRPSKGDRSQLLLDLTMLNSGMVATTVRNLELSIKVGDETHVGKFIPNVTDVFVMRELVPGEKGSRRRIEKPSIDLEITAKNPLIQAVPRECWAHFLFVDLPPDDYKDAQVYLSFLDGAGVSTRWEYVKDIVVTEIRPDYTALTQRHHRLGRDDRW